MEEAKKLKWVGLDCEALEESAKQLGQNIKKLPKSIRTSDAYIGMDRAVKEFTVTCPIIAALQVIHFYIAAYL